MDSFHFNQIRSNIEFEIRSVNNYCLIGAQFLIRISLYSHRIITPASRAQDRDPREAASGRLKTLTLRFTIANYTVFCLHYARS